MWAIEPGRESGNIQSAIWEREYGDECSQKWQCKGTAELGGHAYRATTAPGR